MQILTYSSLYPNNVDPSHGIFVERRLRELVARTDIRSTIVAPVPWFPFRARMFGEYGAMASITKTDRRFDMDILRPRFPLLPKFGMNSAARLMSIATRRLVEKCVKERFVRLIDAHYFYPDGVAASLLARALDLPYIITARGSDINLIAQHHSPRKQMLRAAQGASALVAVSEALAEEMRGLGMPAAKIHVLRNGVDLDFFQPACGAKSDRVNSIVEPVFLSIGTLKRAKGHDIAIRFIGETPGARLFVIGRGPEEVALRDLADQLGISDRVEFTGTLDAESLRERYRSAVALILMSEREGMPNVVLESLACGTPVMATPVGGIPEILVEQYCGELVADRTARGLTNAWRKLSQRKIDQDRIGQFARQFSWQGTIEGLHELMQDAAIEQ